MLRKANETKEVKILKLEKKCNDQEVSVNDKLSKLEKRVSVCEKKFKCDKCCFERNTEKGLKTHISKQHQKGTEVNDNTFP